MSPWLDLSGSQTYPNNPHKAFDFITNYDDILHPMNDALRPSELPFDTPEISPVLVKDVSRLPPQLLFYGDTEVLASDSVRWIKRVKDAGGMIEVHAGRGQMHTYALGWPISGAEMERECDEIFLNWIFAQTGGGK